MLMMSLPYLQSLCYQTAPPLNPAWIEYEESGHCPSRQGLPVTQRREFYATQCRDILARMTADGSRDRELAHGVCRSQLTVPSTLDSYEIPILQLDSAQVGDGEPDVIVLYYHGGGLSVGEADSEELSCRRIVKSLDCRVRIFSIGYRLLPDHPGTICLADALDAFNKLRSPTAKNIVVGSSSGGQLASAICQLSQQDFVHGLLLRCPVTSDATSGKEYVPRRFQRYHTSQHPTFVTSIFEYLRRDTPRDGLNALPLEATSEELVHHPRTWLQLCTNDTLYSDGLCYAMALAEENVPVEFRLWKGWPHTFWLKAPELDASLAAELEMIEGLQWLLK